MKGKNNKRIVILVAILVLSLTLASTAFAADNYKNLKAWFGEIKIFHNSAQVQLKDKAFIVDGTTYLPVRSVAEMLNKDITWDGTSYSIGINDKQDPAYTNVLNENIVQKVKIIELENKVKDLEAKLKVKEESVVSTLTDMEKKLNKSYGTRDKIDFSIDLYGTTSSIEVRVYINDRTSSDRWTSWRTSDNKSFLQEITNDILREFKNAKVSGFIEDKYPTKTIKTKFDVSSNGTVSVDDRNNNNNNNNYYGDLERTLNTNYAYQSNGINDIKVSEGYNNVYIAIRVDNRDWIKGYPTATQQRLLEDMFRDVSRDYNYNYSYKYSDVTGDVRDNSGNLLFNFEFNSNGTVWIR